MLSPSKKPQPELERRIQEEEDFIYAPKFGNSLNTLMSRSGECIPDKKIAQYLLTTEEEIKKIYSKIIVKLRRKLKVKVNSK